MNTYLEAAGILESGAKTSLKSLVYNPRKPLSSDPSRLYALLAETIKFREVLEEVLSKSGVLVAEKKITQSLGLLFAHDYLFTKSGIAASNGPLKDAFLRHKTRVSAEFTRARLKRGYASTQALVEGVNVFLAAGGSGSDKENGEDAIPNPRWIRVNTLKSTIQNVLSGDFFKGFEKVDTIGPLFDLPTKKYYYVRPDMLPDIFAIHPSHKITTNNLYLSGSIILQTASSCLPALLLNPPAFGQVIDTCAAPGNKTTHLASLMNGQGIIFAVEKDKLRGNVLEKMAKRAGAGSIVQFLKETDSMTLKPSSEEYKNVEYLLLDPSCSGSGILNRLDIEVPSLSAAPAEVLNGGSSNSQSKTRKRKRKQETVNSEIEEQDISPATKDPSRLESLAAFQLSLITFALSFPSAKRITYSTCSVHDEENEHVVARALNSKVAKQRGWTVENRDQNKLRNWTRRGKPEAMHMLDNNSDDNEKKRIAEGCIRVNRSDGLGGGFFVVCFVRNKADSLPCSSKEEEEEEDGQYDGEEGQDEEWNGIDADNSITDIPESTIQNLNGQRKKREKRNE